MALSIRRSVNALFWQNFEKYVSLILNGKLVGIRYTGSPFDRYRKKYVEFNFISSCL